MSRKSRRIRSYLGARDVHEPPSDQLVRQLTDLQLCQPRDLFKARGRVRRLSYDLPAFDSVWIDSLVQLRLLTPYQARQLESGHGEGLRIGSFVAVDELGRSSRGSTFLARRLHRRDRCVVKRFRMTSTDPTETRHQLNRLLEQLDGFVHPQLVVPHEIIPSADDELVMVSRFVPGLPLNELLVRRGRFPATVVFEIGRQLLEGLAALHAKSLVHGDIRLSNIRLTESGLAVLVNGAVRPVIHPQFTIHDGLSLDAYDGLAPELIGTGAPPTASSEMYALGCVLWQLLTGRPPFISADPLAKIASHQTRTIEDVRAWAPDTPAMLADSIRQLTSSSPDSRPRSFEEVLQNWGHPGSFSRSRLRQFRRLFNGAVPHFSKSPKISSVGKWVWMTAALFGITSGMALFYDQGLRNELLNVGQNIETMLKTSRGEVRQSPRAAQPESVQVVGEGRLRGVLPLPLPSADGVILLTERGPYEASDLAFEGPLTIRGQAGSGAEISVTNTPLGLTAPSVTLEGVTISRKESNSVVAMITVRSEQLNLTNCEFLGSGWDSESSDASPNGEVIPKGIPAVAWRLPGGRQSPDGAISIRNSIFHGSGISLFLAQTPRSIRIDNTLKTGIAPFLALGPKSQATEFLIDLDRVTLRKSGPLLRVTGEFANKIGAAPISIKAENCVFKLLKSDTALILVDADSLRSDIAQSVQMTAADSVVEAGTMLFAMQDRARDQLVELDGDEQFEGLVAGEIKFLGSQLHQVADAKIASIQGPRTTESTHPGINPALLGPNTRR